MIIVACAHWLADQSWNLATYVHQDKGSPQTYRCTRELQAVQHAGVPAQHTFYVAVILVWDLAS